ncbi:hypothetical protein AS219_02710 [Neorickettsia sp. 179522]|nr:hypothetical protein AS219_02710 [Neorickettsia sp. 179522]
MLECELYYIQIVSHPLHVSTHAVCSSPGAAASILRRPYFFFNYFILCGDELCVVFEICCVSGLLYSLMSFFVKMASLYGTSCPQYYFIYVIIPRVALGLYE